MWTLDENLFTIWEQGRMRKLASLLKSKGFSVLNATSIVQEKATSELGSKTADHG